MRISDWSSDVCSSDLPDRLKALGVTAGEISNQLRSMQQEAPGGRSDLNGLVQSVRTLGTVSSAAELAQVSLPLPDGRRPRLADIATVKDTHAQSSQLALLDGRSEEQTSELQSQKRNSYA